MVFRSNKIHVLPLTVYLAAGLIPSVAPLSPSATIFPCLLCKSEHVCTCVRRQVGLDAERQTPDSVGLRSAEERHGGLRAACPQQAVGVRSVQVSLLFYRTDFWTNVGTTFSETGWADVVAAGVFFLSQNVSFIGARPILL